MSTTREYVNYKEAQLQAVSTRRIHDKHPGKTQTFRSDADVDYARVLYSSAFRRLQGKMQLFAPKSEVLYRNRMTHSHEVAQVAKTIAQKLGLKDTLTVQTCSLAHDLGNPPFGHAGEVFLGKFTDSPYEGNAQSFRILTTVEERHWGFPGVNLTLRTMLGIVKYFFKIEDNPKKFLYPRDYDLVAQWKKDFKIDIKTLDCEIMDIADEIAYAAHDLEDALKLKYFTIDDLIYEFSISPEFSEVTPIFESIVIEAKSFGRKATAYKTSEEYSMLFRKELTSLIVHKLILDVDVVSGDRLGYSKLGKLSAGLKKLTFEAIKRQPDVIEYEQLGTHVLQSLYELYLDKGYNPGLVLLPANYRTESDPDAMIQDYIGGMTDLYAITQYEKYFGTLEKRGIYFKKLPRPELYDQK